MSGAAPDLDWGAVLPAVVLFAAMVLPGLGRGAGKRDFFLAGCTAQAGTVGASLLATVLGASGSLGIVSLAYSLGWGAFWWLGSGALGLLLLAWLWAPAMRRTPGLRTLPGWAGELYGTPARQLAAALIAVMWTAVVAAQWTAAGSILSLLFSRHLAGGIIGVAVCVTGYTAWGGQISVLRTDRWQLPMIVAAAVGALLFAHHLPLEPRQTQAGWALCFEGLSLSSWLGLVVVVGGMYIVGPDLCSRVLLAANDRAARLGALWAGLALLPISLLIVGIGVRLRHSGIVLGSPRDALPWLIAQSGVVPGPVAGIISAGLLAAVVSSADTCLLTAASVLELDLVGRNRGGPADARRGRLFVVAVGVASLLIALWRPTIIANLMLAYAFYAGGLLLPLLLGIRRQAPFLDRPAWVWAAMVLGGLTPVVLLLSGRETDSAAAGLYGVCACGAVLALGALCTRVRRRPVRP